MAKRALSPSCLAIVQAVERALPAALAATRLTTVTVGLSGGADSLALTAAVAWARRRTGGPLAGLPVTAHVIDHGLQTDSATVAARAAAQAESLGLPAVVSRVEVEPTGAGLEADARHQRYQALLADATTLVAVGHTLDDQAETVLLGLARGSGTRSLAGMPWLSGRVVRPGLTLRRTQTEQACQDWGLEPWQDPMNDDPHYRRVQVRQALADLDRLLGPGLAQALARTADLARQDADWLDQQAAQAGLAVTQASGLAVTELAELPPALAGRVVLAWLRGRGVDDVGWGHVQAIMALVNHWHGQVGVDVPGGRVARQAGHLLFHSH
ncbi:MAG: tRNA lysidine(34) synthetase TilS [Propionibacteriaceae bacterium]|jgi:tRNA(Ile)-lysidine synthase|nr:tRNA lysidine(34) synthetase TilS [Propionibacteriaceae bacterium]